jgi:hypothetical protein
MSITLIDRLDNMAKLLYDEYHTYDIKNQQLFDAHIYGFLIMFSKINLQDLAKDNFIIQCVVDTEEAEENAKGNTEENTEGNTEGEERETEGIINIIDDWHLIGYIFYADNDDNMKIYDDYNPPYELSFGWDVLFVKILQECMIDFDCYIFEKILRQQYGFFKGKPPIASYDQPVVNPPVNPPANSLANPPAIHKRHNKTIRTHGRMSITPIRRRGKKVKTLKNREVRGKRGKR